jgi:hypothetical protein
VQRIPGYGEKVEPVILDGLVSATWPRFLHPYPLNDKYFIVSCKPSRSSLWGIYLVDVFDNITLLAEVEGAALLEPVPLLARPRPPVLPDRVTPGAKTASVHIADIYSGPGLHGVPRGTARKIRVFSYHFA